MSQPDLDYYRARAVEERVLAVSAAEENVAAIQEELARQYDALSAQPLLRTKLSIVV